MRYKFNKFSKTGARELDSFYHMAIKLLKKSQFWRAKVKVLPSFLKRRFTKSEIR